MRKNSTELYNEWLESTALSEEQKAELMSIKDDAGEIEERFYVDLEFGTAGMRGVLGMGTNRMNVFTVRRAAQGLANYIEQKCNKDDGVVIGYDTRYFSEDFAKDTAKVLIANGIKVYLFDCVHATPEVSFAIRHYKAAAGVMITASHNPKQYNGFKGYGSDGGQFPPEASDIVVEAVNNLDIFNDIKMISDEEFKNSPLLTMLGKDCDEKFLDAVTACAINPDIIKKVADKLTIIYTPFHGTGLRPVVDMYKRIGMKNVIVEPKQAIPDPAFSTVKSPNPEDKDGFRDAIELAKENNAALIIGTDPDADRVGVVVKDSAGEYQVLSGNQTGALLCEYMLNAKKQKGELNEKSTIIKTIVTSEMSDAIAESYGAQVINVLTGFKYIGEQMTNFRKTGSNEYVIGFEESFGYLIGEFARDKDAIGATMMITEMAAWYFDRGMTLYDGLMELYEKYGYYLESTISLYMEGKDGMEKMAATMESIRGNMPDSFGEFKVAIKQDILTSIQVNADGSKEEIKLPKSNVLKFGLAEPHSFVVVRPSGTEPKIKLYLGVTAPTLEDSKAKLEKLTAEVRATFNM